MIDKDGYERLHINGVNPHPHAAGRNTIMRHVLIMERLIDRPIRPDECVHHIDGNRTNNDPGNLELMSRRRHQQISANRQRRDKFGRFK